MGDEFIEKALSKARVLLTDGKEINIVYDCSDAHFNKTLARWMKKTKDFSGESLCREIHRKKPFCIAVTEEQFQEAFRQHGTTEEAALPRRVSTQEYEAQLKKEKR